MGNLSPERLLQTAASVGSLRVVRAALDLGVFTELGKGPRTCDQLCRRLGLSRHLAPGLLDALVALGWLEREGDDPQAVYVNTREAGHFLDQRSAAFLGPLLEFTESSWLNPSRGLAEALRDAGRAPGIERPATITTRLAAWSGEALADRLDFSQWHRMLVIDAGDGSAQALLEALTSRQPHLLGSIAKPPLDEGSWPTVDVLVLHLVGGSSELQRMSLLRRSQQALVFGGCLIVIDYVLDETRRQSTAAWLHTLARQIEGAQEPPSTVLTLRVEFEQAGFGDVQCLSLVGGASALIVRR